MDGKRWRTLSLAEWDYLLGLGEDGRIINGGKGYGYTCKWSGNVFDFYFRVINRMLADVKVPFQLKDGLTRVDDTPVHKALREALTNALVHADYGGRCGVVINKSFRHVRIQNPGVFRLSIEDAICGGVSGWKSS